MTLRRLGVALALLLALSLSLALASALPLSWLTSGYSSGVLRVNRDSINSFIWPEGAPPLGKNAAGSAEFTRLRSQLLRRVEAEARRILGGGDGENYVHPMPQAGEYPYFNWLPTFLDRANATHAPKWAASESSCFRSNSAQLRQDSSGNFTLEVTVGDPSGFLCSDFYLFASLDSVLLHTFSSAGTTSFEWPSPLTPELQWDLDVKGVRVFRFPSSALQAISDLLDTVMLFEKEEGSPKVPQHIVERNLDFIQKYAGLHYEPRTPTQGVMLDESEIASGDLFAMVRFDGLNPTLAWAMGSTTGHVTVALWKDNELRVCESTVESSHWDINGVQCNPYRKWIEKVKAAGSLVVHTPLTPKARALFNETAANEFFERVEGFDYGYRNILYAWLDTPEHNYPCLPPDFKRCMSWEQFEVIFGLMDSAMPSLADLFFRGAFNLRLGTTGLNLPQLMKLAAEKGIEARDVPTMVEQDGWVYNTTRYGEVAEGPSMVCCVFTCSVWKHAGVFAELTDEIQCAELTNWDDFSLAVLDTPPRPPQCVAADPTNPLCQLEGDYTLLLNDYASKVPYARMAQRCPSQAPDYERPKDC